ncbi:MAG: YggT family protein [Candidatus Andersenbacteria bacterium]
MSQYTQQPVSPQAPQQAYRQKKAIFRAYQVIWYILGVLEVLLAFRFLLRLLEANPASGFVSFVYGVSAPFIAPFRAIFPTPSFAGSVLEWSTLIAMIVYAVIAYGIIHLLQIGKPVDVEEVEKTVDSQ